MHIISVEIATCRDLKVIYVNLWQGTKLTFSARSHLAPKFSKVVAKAKKLGAI